MICRRASLIDLTDLVVFAKAKHAESNWSDIAFNAPWFRQQVRRSISDAESCVFIVRKDGELCGLLIGVCGPMLYTPLRCATDQVFVADAGGELLMSKFMEWCSQNKVKRIDMGNSQAERKGVDRFMRRYGMQRSGGMYFKNEVTKCRA